MNGDEQEMAASRSRTDEHVDADRYRVAAEMIGRASGRLCSEVGHLIDVYGTGEQLSWSLLCLRGQFRDLHNERCARG